MTPKVSIIVPFYNVEKYISQCIASILSQTLTAIEVICVDDFSPDNSIEIVKQYANIDSRIKIVRHDNNQGLGPARNTGLAVAVAPYVLFVDSDDYIDRNMVKALYDNAIKSDCDVVWCYANSVSEDGVECPNTDQRISGIFTSEEVLREQSLYPSILPVWNKMYKRNLIKDISQPAIVSEDQPFLAEWLIRCKKIQIINDALYYYRNRPGTLSKPKIHTTKNWDDFFNSHSLFFDILKNKSFDEKAIQTQCSKRLFSMLWRIKAFRLIEQPTWKEQKETISKHLKSRSIPIAKYSPLSLFLRFAFNSNLSSSLMKKVVNRLYKYSKNWCISNSWSTTFKMLTKDSARSILNIGIWMADKIEIIFMKILSSFVCNNSTWIIGERIDTAQENGIYFYNYVRRLNPEINVVYVCNKAVAISCNIENWVQYGSFRHKLKFLSAKVYANSQYNAAYPHTICGNKKYTFPQKCLNVFLQHGITYADVSPFYGKHTSDIDLFICGAKPEYEAVSKNFGYESKQVCLTGFARFDGLHDYVLKRQILLMPTWRRNLDNVTKEEFEKSTYFKTLYNLMCNSALISFLRDANIKLKFCPHHLMNRYLSLFSDLENDVIEIAKKESIQDLLKESMILITDVSSVQFDFVYMNKPVVYFQWDYEQLKNEHLHKGYFDFETMGFGTITHNAEEVISALSELKNNDWETKSDVKSKIENFFPLRDTNNCERIYNEIINRV